MSYLFTRLLSAFLSGVLLSQAGSLIQLGTKNLLSSPSTLGFDGLAVLWILLLHSLSVFLGLNVSVVFSAAAFSLLGLLYARFLTGVRSYDRLVLIGITFNLLVGAIFSLWQFFFMAFNLPFPVELWFGHFRFASLEAVAWLLVTEAAIVGILFKLRHGLLLISLGPTVARNWGVERKTIFSFLLIGVALSTFVVIYWFGAFSFLGLVFPIIARKLWFARADLKGEMLAGALTNGVVFMGLDFVCFQWPILGAELPVGLVVTGAGAVSLILLLWQQQKPSKTLAFYQD